MKNLFKRNLIALLGWLAKKMIKKHQPEIIGITGSMGKTSCKEAVKLVLGSKYQVLAPERSYNTEIGLPLTVFAEKVPVKIYSLLGWLLLILRCFSKLIFWQNYPKILILEMGADKPGDIGYLTNLAKPHISIVTSVAPTHLLRFKTVEEVAQEKSVIIQCLNKDDFALLNIDDEQVRKMASKTQAKVIFYGFNPQADLVVLDLNQKFPQITFRLKYQNEEACFKLNLLADYLVYSLLPAIACGIIYGFSLPEIARILKDYRPPKGRMNLIEGVNQSLIIDDSYNSNPQAALAALEVLAKFEGRKIAALGTMNELGEYEEEGHRLVGQKVAEVADLLITVGEPARKYLASEANKSGLPASSIFCFKDSLSAGEFLRSRLEKGDVVLVKGSQNNVRMEWLVEKIMAHPEEAASFLVRQGPEWDKPSQLKKV